jgi:hypothetical protein
MWADSVIQLFATMINLDKPHCPILATSEGFSRDIAPATSQLYIDDAQAMFFPNGKLFSEQAKIDHGDPAYRTIFLPKI